MLSLVNISLAFGGPPLLDSVSLDIQQGERLALVGRNGSGKSSLMRILSGINPPDSGDLIVQGSCSVATMIQEIPVSTGLSASQILRSEIENIEEWEIGMRIERLLEELELKPDMQFDVLSFGQRRKLLLGRALIKEPDLLLLDEPTNHLDVEAIEWMENRLKAFKGAVLFITHDRSFLKGLATSVIDLDRGKLTRWDCTYDQYLERKEASLEAESKHWDVFDKKLAQEEAWIRQGIKARRTRNEGRVRSLQKLRKERSERRDREGKSSLNIKESGLSGYKVITAKDISSKYDETYLYREFECEIVRGDRIGVLGPNGCGKSTLIRTLLKELTPDSGTIEHGTSLEIAWFDQNREQLDEDSSVFDNIADGNEFISINGERKHVISHLKDFLFTSEQARGPISNLSGGEKNRLLLARLFAKSFNLLVMDEPTNDLDLETMELLEEQLSNYKGTLILVSHDRTFIDNVVTELWVFENRSVIQKISGGYEDYLLYRDRIKAPEGAKTKHASKGTSKKGKPQKTRKFLNRERRELEEIPQKIETLENEQESIVSDLANPQLLKSEPSLSASHQSRMAQIEEELLMLFDRWEELETLRKELEGDSPSHSQK